MNLRECVECSKTFQREKQFKVNNDLCDDCRKKINEKRRLTRKSKKKYSYADDRADRYSKFIDRNVE